MPKIWMSFLVFLLAAGLGAGIPAHAQEKVPVPSPNDISLGKEDAPITIYEYGSLDCPHCAEFDETTLPKIKEIWIDTGKARLVFRDYPLSGAAVYASMAAHCAPKEQFYGFVDMLFRSQATWGHYGQRDPQVRAQMAQASLAKLVKVGGMSDETFAACMRDEALRKRLLEDAFQGQRDYGVDSTPTFFVSGVKLVGARPYEEFAKELSAAEAKPKS
jgi:protein-disulfide isomerase